MSFILNWHTPGVDLPRYGLFGSDTSPVNLYLLSEKYNIEVAELDGILFRRYNGKNINRNGYGFPLSHSSFDMEKVLRILENDSKERGEGLRFCLCDENQKNAIDAFRNVKWESFDGDSDYIYSCESLSRLVGRHFRGQRNLINRFSRIYSTIEYSPLTEQKLPEALKVAERGCRSMMSMMMCCIKNGGVFKKLRNIGKNYLCWAVFFLWTDLR